MKVTTDAVQVLGGYGYTRDFPVERYMREAKITQIFEGTNQIQRLVISRGLARPMSSRRLGAVCLTWRTTTRPFRRVPDLPSGGAR